MADQQIHTLVLIRHGQSVWNQENRFTGWTDVELSEQGETEAQLAAIALKKAGLTFDIAYSSVLKREIKTLWIILEQLNLMWIPVRRNWRLNERHYGALQGLNKKETAELKGEEQVKLWRRSYDVPPPALDPTDERHPSHDPRYKHLDPSVLPAAESLKDTLERVKPYWEETIAPSIKEGKKVLIAGHGNSLRALMKHLDNIADADIPNLEIPTAQPIIYTLDQNLKPIDRYFLDFEVDIEKVAIDTKNITK